MNIHCLRHGETNYNRLGLCNDDPTQDCHLTTRGIVQAEEAAVAVRTLGITALYHSPLPRTRHTAEIVNRAMQLTLQPVAALADIRSGCDSRPVAEYFAAIAHDPLHARVGHGETVLEHKERVLGFIRWLTTQPDTEVLVVAHEETLRVFAAYAAGLADEQLRTLHFVNCQLYSYRVPAKPD